MPPQRLGRVNSARVAGLERAWRSAKQEKGNQGDWKGNTYLSVINREVSISLEAPPPPPPVEKSCVGPERFELGQEEAGRSRGYHSGHAEGSLLRDGKVHM